MRLYTVPSPAGIVAVEQMHHDALEESEAILSRDFDACSILEPCQPLVHELRHDRLEREVGAVVPDTLPGLRRERRAHGFGEFEGQVIDGPEWIAW